MKRNSFVVLGALLLSFIQVSVYADHCYVVGIGGACYFDSLHKDSNKHVYYHCEVGPSYYVKMYNHNVLISGFVPGSGPGAGTLTLTGTDAKEMLDNYYFEVKNHQGHNGSKYVIITSAGPIKCGMGTGGRKMAFPGEFGISK